MNPNNEVQRTMMIERLGDIVMEREVLAVESSKLSASLNIYFADEKLKDEAKRERQKQSAIKIRASYE